MLYSTPCYVEMKYFFFFFLLAIFIGYCLSIYSFLAVNMPLHGELLVIEGWLPKNVLEDAVMVFNKGPYQSIVVVGGPSTGKKADRIEDTQAFTCKQQLIGLGIPEQKMFTVPVWEVSGNRTYASAMAVAKWLEISTPHFHSIDVFTVSVHGRKSWLLYRRALGDFCQVGIISAESKKFNPTFWWLSPPGIYLVLRNTFAFAYAVFFIK